MVESFKELTDDLGADFDRYLFNSSSCDINSKVCTNGPNRSTLKKYIFYYLSAHK